MEYAELVNTNPIELCASVGKSIETDICQKHLTKRGVAKQAGVTEGTVRRICSGQNVRLESLIRVLKVVNRYTALQGLVTAAPVEPMSLYADMVKERALREKKHGTHRAVRQNNYTDAIRASDIREMCE